MRIYFAAVQGDDEEKRSAWEFAINVADGTPLPLPGETVEYQGMEATVTSRAFVIVRKPHEPQQTFNVFITVKS